jgi:hypothetical protein
MTRYDELSAEMEKVARMRLDHEEACVKAARTIAEGFADFLRVKESVKYFNPESGNASMQEPLRKTLTWQDADEPEMKIGLSAYVESPNGFIYVPHTLILNPVANSVTATTDNDLECTLITIEDDLNYMTFFDVEEKGSFFESLYQETMQAVATAWRRRPRPEIGFRAPTT